MQSLFEKEWGWGGEIKLVKKEIKMVGTLKKNLKESVRGKKKEMKMKQ